MDSSLFGIFSLFVGMLVPILIGLIVLMFATRIVTRIAIDEVRKDRERRGPL